MIANRLVVGAAGTVAALAGAAVTRDICASVDSQQQPNTCRATMSSDFRSRSVQQVVFSQAQSEGMGARVRRSIGSSALRNFDPFLLLDEFDVGKGAGFPDHPHRGFETVTYMLEGFFEHEDFAGHRGKIGPGDLQWMTAGKGIVHAEMPLGEGRSRGLQLWVNLKGENKLIDPAYQELKKEDIPTKTVDGVTAVVIAGSALGITSPVYTRTPVHYIHFKMDPGSTLQHVIPEDMNAFLYTLEGAVGLNGAPEGEKIEAHNTVTLKRVRAARAGRASDGDGIAVETFAEAADFVLICGQPLKEPVVQHGPFVMNTRQEINEAMMDYQANQKGFESASAWYSQIGLPLTHADRSR